MAATNCFICSKPQQPATYARPDCCPNHFFHRSCLTQLAQRRAKCPIDSKEFQRIHCFDGTIINVCSNAEDSSSSSPNEIPAALRELEAALRESAQRQYQGSSNSNFTCSLCNRGGGGERAKPNACDHEFHRDCLNTYTDKNNLCPTTGCRSEISHIRCQFGDRISIVNPLKAMLSAVAAGGSFRCSLCGEDDPMRERALTKPCGHEFHKGCLIERCRRNNTCPRCSKTVTGLNCMLSEDLTVDSKNSCCLM